MNSRINQEILIIIYYLIINVYNLVNYERMEKQVLFDETIKSE